MSLYSQRICRTSTPTQRKLAKKGVTRKRRRAEKKDPENAPNRLREITKGWAN